jgi:hypothetical protein
MYIPAFYYLDSTKPTTPTEKILCRYTSFPFLGQNPHALQVRNNMHVLPIIYTTATLQKMYMYVYTCLLLLRQPLAQSTRI